MKKAACLFLVFSWLGTSALAQKALTDVGVSNTETFTGFTGSGFAPEPAAGWLDSDEFSVAGFDEDDTGTDGACLFGDTCPHAGGTTDFNRGISEGDDQLAGGIYAFDHDGLGDMGLGWQAKSKDFTPGSITVQYRNDSQLAFTDMDVAYEVWLRNSDSGSHMVSLSYGTGECSVMPTFHEVAGTTVTSPDGMDEPSAWADHPVAVSLTLSEVVLPLECFFIQFNGDAATGVSNQDEMSVDNIVVTATAGQSPPPTVLFSATVHPNTMIVDFDASASFDDGTITAYDWDFGDGNTGSGEMVTHIYDAPGTYTVTATLTDDGDLSNAETMDVVISASDPLMESGGLIVVEAESFMSRITRGAHSWVFSTEHGGSGIGAMVTTPDDGTNIDRGVETDASELTFDVDIDSVGTYYFWMRLYAPNDDGNSVHGGVNGNARARKMSTDTIGEWVWTNLNTKGDTVGVGLQEGGLATLNLWMREDGTFIDKFLMTTDPAYVPTGEGPAESPRDAIDTPPVAAFTTAGGSSPLEMSFDGTTSSDDGTITAYDWNFGDGSTGTGSTVVHAYGAAGSYTVKLTVTDDGGQMDSVEQVVDVADDPPVADFTSAQVFGTLEVAFDGTPSTDDGSITTYDWDLGDGSTAAGATLSHTYAAAGTYTVMLTVTDDAAQTGAVSMDVTVTDPGAVGAFLEADGMVVMEAESYFTTIDRSDHSWVLTTDYAGYSGGGAMVTTPNDDLVVKKRDALTLAPEMTYDVDFTALGSFYVWMRVYSESSDDNTIHGALNGNLQASKMENNTFNEWAWTNVDTKGRASTVGVTAAGANVFQILMREDGLVLDKIILTTDAAFVPTGEGPAESGRAAAGPSTSEQAGGIALAAAGLVPIEYALESNYPNPFAEGTSVRYALPEAADVRIEVYDVLGRRVTTIVDDHQEAGRYSASWNGTSESGARLASGLYLYRMTAGDFTASRTMVLAR